MQLRHYQRAAIDCLWAHLRAHDDNPCIVMPTGSGKSPTMAGIIREALAWPGTRIAVLAHVKELVEQNADKLRQYWPDAPQGTIGINAASLRRRDRFNPVLFCQIQSVHDKAMELGAFDLVLVDEAHRIPIAGEGMYRRFLDDCRRANPRVRFIGLTATPYRLGIGPVCGPEYMLNSICYEASIRDLIEQGFLCRLISKRGVAQAQPDLTDVKMRGGEYIERDLAQAVDRAELVTAACDEICRLGADRQAWILFCASVKHAQHVVDAMEARGIACGLVHGQTPAGERTQIIQRFQRGQLRAIANVNVLSEGFDAPHVDLVALLRPTKSPGLYVQQVGRGLRLDKRKDDCLVLDYAGNVLEHGPIDQIRVQKPRRRGEKAEVITAPTKACPQCQSHCGTSVTVCPDCGFIFPRALAKHDATASDAPILAGADAPTVLDHQVDSVSYAVHQKPGSPDSMVVVYSCGLRTFREWVCVEHAGHARARAVAWWMSRCPVFESHQIRAVPITAADAVRLAPHLIKPARIRVRESGKYPEVVAHEFPSSSGTDDTEHQGQRHPRAGSGAAGAAGDASGHAL